MTREEAISRLKKGEPFSEIYDSSWNEALDMAISALEKNESAEEWYKLLCEKMDSVENKGEWIETYDEIDARYSRHGYKCPKCDKFAHYFVGGSEDWWDIEKPNFCPNCGADMRGEVE